MKLKTSSKVKQGMPLHMTIALGKKPSEFKNPFVKKAIRKGK